MFEKEVKFIADFNLNKIKNFGSFITFDKILNSSLHPAVLQYISAELDYLIDEDRKKLLQQSVFDYSGPDVAKYFHLIAQEVKKTKKISFEDIKKLVVQAVSFNINFLIKPNWSLLKMVYNQADSKPTEEINLIFNYVYYYDYIKNIFNSYIQKRRIIVLSATEFELILNKIDKELFESQAQKLIENAMTSIAEFTNLGSGHKTRILPGVLESYLKEKNQMDYLIKLRKKYPSDSKQSVDIKEIGKVLFSSPAGKFQSNLFEEETIELEDASELEEMENEEKFSEEEIQLETETGMEEEIEIEPDKDENEIILDDSSHEELNMKNDSAEKDTEVKDEEKTTENAEEIEIEPDKDADEINLDDSSHEELNIENDSLEKNTEVKDEEKTTEKVKENETEEMSVESEAAEVPDESEFKIDEELLNMYEKELETNSDKTDELNEESDEYKSEPEKDIEPEMVINNEEENEELLKDLELEIEDEEKINVENIVETNELQNPAEETLEIADEENSEQVPDEESKQEEEDVELSIEIPEEEYEKNTPSQKENLRTRDLFEFITDKEIEKIVGSVFNDDREDFANTMERLTECSNYDEATEILKSVFLTYRVNPYSRDAIILTNSVSNYFSQA